MNRITSSTINSNTFQREFIDVGGPQGEVVLRLRFVVQFFNQCHGDEIR